MVRIFCWFQSHLLYNYLLIQCLYWKINKNNSLNFFSELLEGNILNFSNLEKSFIEEPVLQNKATLAFSIAFSIIAFSIIVFSTIAFFILCNACRNSNFQKSNRKISLNYSFFLNTRILGMSFLRTNIFKLVFHLIRIHVQNICYLDLNRHG